MTRSTLRIIQLILTVLLLCAAIAFAGDVDEPRSCFVNCESSDSFASGN